MNRNPGNPFAFQAVLAAVKRLATSMVLSVMIWFNITPGYGAPDFSGEHVVFTNGMVSINSDTNLPEDFCLKVADIAKDCLQYSAEQQGLPLSGRFTQLFTLHLISPQLMDSNHPHTGLSCVGPGDILARYTAFQNPAFAFGALTHELTHMLHNRIGGGLLTHYLEEGTAQNIQRHFDEKFYSQRGRYLASCRNETVLLANMSADEAARLMGQLDWTREDIGATEDLGCFFVEYLRLKLNGAGFPDAYKRIAVMVSNIPPRMARSNQRWRAAYDQALRNQFGAGAEREFISYLRKTEHNPQARLSGTFFEPWLSDPVVKKKLFPSA